MPVPRPQARPHAPRSPSTKSLLLVAILAGACGPAEVAPQPQAPRVAAYRVPPSTAGSESCAACHRSIVDSWSQTGMARSLGPVQLGELDGLSQPRTDASGYRYQYGRTPDQREHVLVETHTDVPTHAFATAVALGIGSGELDRSYALRFGHGLRFSPLEVLPDEGSRRSELAPGHMMSPGLRFDIPITNECLACHTDQPPAARFPLDLKPAADWQPRGISCAACHGQSEAHALWQESDALSGDPLVRHGQLSRSERLSICAACHLQGDARVDLSGDPEARFEPGEELFEQRAVFVAADASNEVGFVSHVERLVLSECFSSSAMTCGTCHNPHKSLHQEEERQRVRQACLQCHDSGEAHASPAPDTIGVAAPECSQSLALQAQAADCASCHMPKVGTFDVAHVQIHDHHIRRNIEQAPGPTDPGSLRVLETKSGQLERFGWPWKPKPPGDPGLEMLAYASAKLEAQALQRVDQAPGPKTLGLPLYHHLRGLLLERLGRLDEAQAAYLRALELDPEMPAASINLASLMAKGGRPRAAYRLLTEVLERHPQAEGALRNRAVIAMQLGEPSRFAADLQKAFVVKPSAELAQTLSQYFASQGDSLGASRWLSLARDLDPLLAR